MNCEQAQEIILTDYIDGCLAADKRVQLEGHLQNCTACKEFCSVAREKLVAPFESLPRESLPASVVANIMNKVQEQESARPAYGLTGWLETLRAGFFNTNSYLAWSAAVLVCFILAGAGQRVYELQQADKKARVLYLAEVTGLSSGKGQVADYGTSIETYFLDNGGSI